MSVIKNRARHVHELLKECFPRAFPRDYDAIIPLKTGIEDDIIARLAARAEWPDRSLIQRVLNNHTSRAGYLLAILHHKGNRRYDLDGRAVEDIDDAARAEAEHRLKALQERQQAQATRYRAQKAFERDARIVKAKRKAEKQRAAAEKQRRREKHERNRQRNLERSGRSPNQPTPGQPPTEPPAPDVPALLSPREPSQPRTPTVIVKKKRRPFSDRKS